MTRDEDRAKCTEAIKGVLVRRFGSGWPLLHVIAAEILDSLHGVAFVDPIEATEEMLYAARNFFSDPLMAYETIAAAGDLANPARTKP